ncbi:hypothetical protein HGP17_25160 [Rhizobium sp. P38BS-XIX]|uniref:hypothetical protein n=1 Tax=Rhizobium sp. P38BS-XIX TaxID=2726740 RepID=UPI001456E7F3|nr:hypothetical protein [Rhizobium sp. P38BS-XIX]NLS00129.1 hypothetical protein [Rhizobium sp. P38BS-XIX]
MKRLSLCLAALLACMTLPAFASAAEAGKLPAEVSAFVERRDGCDHFRGEEATDETRAAEIAAKLESLCKGTDAELATLKKRYARNKAVQKALAVYEGTIE